MNLNVRLEGVTGSVESREFVPENFPRYAARAAAENVARRLTGRDPDCFAPTYYYAAHYEALRAFLEAVRADEPPPVSGRDGRRTIELAEAAFRAAAVDEPTEAEGTFDRPRPARPR